MKVAVENLPLQLSRMFAIYLGGQTWEGHGTDGVEYDNDMYTQHYESYLGSTNKRMAVLLEESALAHLNITRHQVQEGVFEFGQSSNERGREDIREMGFYK